MLKISTFDDWIEFFHQWQKDIGYDPALLHDQKRDWVICAAREVFAPV